MKLAVFWKSYMLNIKIFYTWSGPPSRKPVILGVLKGSVVFILILVGRNHLIFLEKRIDAVLSAFTPTHIWSVLMFKQLTFCPVFLVQYNIKTPYTSGIRLQFVYILFRLVLWCYIKCMILGAHVKMRIKIEWHQINLKSVNIFQQTMTFWNSVWEDQVWWHTNKQVFSLWTLVEGAKQPASILL